MLGKRRQTQKTTHCMIPPIGQFGKGKTIGAENRSVVSRGWGGRRDLTAEWHRGTVGGHRGVGRVWRGLAVVLVVYNYVYSTSAL